MKDFTTVIHKLYRLYRKRGYESKTAKENIIKIVANIEKLPENVEEVTKFSLASLNLELNQECVMWASCIWRNINEFIAKMPVEINRYENVFYTIKLYKGRLEKEIHKLEYGKTEYQENYLEFKKEFDLILRPSKENPLKSNEERMISGVKRKSPENSANQIVF